MLKEAEARALKIFISSFFVFKGFNAFVAKYPKYAIWVYVGKNKRRQHHLELGLYFISIGLALVLDDISDRKAEVEFYEQNRVYKETEKRHRRHMVSLKRPQVILDECVQLRITE